jgi:hypothetical protein
MAIFDSSVWAKEQKFYPELAGELNCRSRSVLLLTLFLASIVGIE